MPEENELLKQLKFEREKVRLNAIKMLKFLGYKGDAKDMTQEQIAARIDLLNEERKKNEIEATKNADVSKPALFTGMNAEQENIDAVKNAAPSELDQQEFMEGYDALTARIQVLRSNNQVAHMESLAPREDIRIIRLPASIKLNEHTSIIRRVLL